MSKPRTVALEVSVPSADAILDQMADSLLAAASAARAAAEDYRQTQQFGRPEMLREDRPRGNPSG